tara:strand:+ start:381 stop:563 length:183 start_codon:yes stop_codon:yes gene_type:complete
MNKYFDTLDIVYNLVKHRPLSQRIKAYENALRQEHDVGPESNYIIKLWEEAEELGKDRRS